MSSGSIFESSERVVIEVSNVYRFHTGIKTILHGVSIVLIALRFSWGGADTSLCHFLLV